MGLVVLVAIMLDLPFPNALIHHTDLLESSLTTRLKLS